MLQWALDPQYAAFAVRVIAKAAGHGARAEALAALKMLSSSLDDDLVRADATRELATIDPRSSRRSPRARARHESAKRGPAIDLGALVIGKVYRRGDLHDGGLGGNRQAGISTRPMVSTSFCFGPDIARLLRIQRHGRWARSSTDTSAVGMDRLTWPSRLATTPSSRGAPICISSLLLRWALGTRGSWAHFSRAGMDGARWTCPAGNRVPPEAPQVLKRSSRLAMPACLSAVVRPFHVPFRRAARRRPVRRAPESSARDRS